MDLARMRQIYEDKAGIQYGDNNTDLSSLMQQYGGKRKANKGPSKKAHSAWQPFLKKALAKRGKTMQNYMNDKELRRSISAEWNRKKAGKAVGRGYDEEDSYDDYMAGSVIGGKKGKKKEEGKSGLKICKNSHWVLDKDGNVYSSSCTEKQTVQPGDKSFNTKFRNTFSFLDEDMQIVKRPVNERQYKAMQDMKKEVKDRKLVGVWPQTASIVKSKEAEKDRIFNKWKNSDTDVGAAIQYALKRGDMERLNKLRDELYNVDKAPKFSRTDSPWKNVGPVRSSKYSLLDDMMVPDEKKADPLTSLLTSK